MGNYLPNKNLIFFNPGISGIVFIQPAKQLISKEQLIELRECLAQKTINPVVYIEDRRAKVRRRRDVQDYLSILGRGKAPFLKYQSDTKNFYI